MSEVICISSSDDESESKKIIKSKNVSKKKEKIMKFSKSKKRKASAEYDPPPEKKRLQTTLISKQTKNEKSPLNKNVDSNTSKKSTKINSEDWNRPSTSKQSDNIEIINYSDDDSRASSLHEKSSKISEAPQLEIKEKRPVIDNHPGSEVFVQFLSQCLSRERSSSMEKIMAKLKRHYEELDSDYARSPEFIDLLNEKRDSLLKNDNRLYIHIADVDKEMKCRKYRKNLPKIEESEAPDEIGNLNNEENDPEKNSKVKKIIKVMDKCNKRIKQLEDAEVDWEDEHENNSNYLKAARYKERVIQLYYKFCELTGEHEDAGRPYLRPKHLKVTKIASVDQAIVSFINKKLTDRVKKMKKGLSAADCVVFPDYVDVLKCIETCNKEQKLDMSKLEIEKLARKSFKELGEYLQSMRQKDFLDTFSMIANDNMNPAEKDPADTDPELNAKLTKSREQGKKRLDNLFQEFVKKQEEGPSKNDENSDDQDDKTDEDNEDDDDDDDEDANSNDIDDISNVGSDFDENSLKADDTKDNDNKDNEIKLSDDEYSDSRETVIIARSPETVDTTDKNLKSSDQVVDDTEMEIDNSDLSKKPRHRVVCNYEGNISLNNRVVEESEGTVIVDRQIAVFENEKNNYKKQKAGPKSSKKNSKPMITNIQNVKVVIKSHEIVKIDKKTRMILNDVKSNIENEIIQSEIEKKIDEIKETIEIENQKLPIDEEFDESLDLLSSVGDYVNQIEKLQTLNESPNKSKIIEKCTDGPETDDVVTVSEGNTSFETCPDVSPKKINEKINDDDNQQKKENSDDTDELEKIIQETIESDENIMIIDEKINNDDLSSNAQNNNNKNSPPVQCSPEKKNKNDIEEKSPIKVDLKDSQVQTDDSTIKILSNTSQKSSQIDKKNGNVPNDEIIENKKINTIIEKNNTLADNNNDKIQEKSKEIDKLGQNNQQKESSSEELTIEKSIENFEEFKEEKDLIMERPVLKVRSFAKPPQSWTSPPEKRQQLCKVKAQKNLSKTIEVVDLDDDDEVEQTNVITSSETIKTSKVLYNTGKKINNDKFDIKIKLSNNINKSNKFNHNIITKNISSDTFNIGTIATGPSTSSGKIIGQVKPIKNHPTLIVGDKRSRAVVIPYKPSASVNQTDGQQKSISLQNAIAGLKKNTMTVSPNVKKIVRKTHCGKQLSPINSMKHILNNPIKKKISTYSSTQKVVNPMAKMQDKRKC